MAHSGGFSIAASPVDSKGDNEKSCCGILRFTYKNLVWLKERFMPETASAMQSEVKNLETEMAVGHGNINSDSADGKRYVSERGPFSIQANHQMKPTIPLGTFEGKKHVAENWDISRLLDDCDNKEKICEMLGEMLELAASGSSEHRLQMQEGENGMRLAHVWFGPNFHLFRHSHPLGDCTYYVAAGELTMGKRRLKAGSTIFVPNEMPYKFVAGPDGVEVLEFRSGGSIPGKPKMKIEETSLASIQKIIDDYKANQHLWKIPPNFSDTGHVKPHEGSKQLAP
tara:strand:+ start:3471 stop:4319 length:849 start_codon:yes stop_codon:yes gene_type:complete